MRRELVLSIVLVFCMMSAVEAFDYPAYVATKQDYINLLSMPEHRDRALAELRQLAKIDDAYSTRVVSGSEDEKSLVTETVSTPRPMWLRKRFKSRDEVLEIINTYSGAPERGN